MRSEAGHATHDRRVNEKPVRQRRRDHAREAAEPGGGNVGYFSTWYNQKEDLEHERAFLHRDFIKKKLAPALLFRCVKGEAADRVCLQERNPAAGRIAAFTVF